MVETAPDGPIGHKTRQSGSPRVIHGQVRRGIPPSDGIVGGVGHGLGLPKYNQINDVAWEPMIERMRRGQRL